ncbi:hypothetical protein H4R18_000897 [Coemansia javaensis]|uniref:Uncharacterized protein n=1 Tax=Coemansia javaensis TaxID=2761396 RepID=A0A9W8HFB1_9FUNG|nr:hypothetical protein H4R18_000897 [Coemansia javaensis]
MRAVWRVVVLLLALLAAGACGSPTLATDCAAGELFGRCPLFDSVVGDRMLSGQITPEQAFAELDSHNCPIIRGAGITSAQQLKQAVDQCQLAAHAGHPDAAGCRRLGELTEMVWAGAGRPRAVMDELVKIDCPSLTACEQFGQIKAQYASGALPPSRAIQQLVQRCPHFSPPARAPQAVARAAAPAPAPATGAPPGQSMADECRRLSDMLYAVGPSPDSSADAAAAQRAMDALTSTKVRIINNCPLFQSVKARYQGGQITAWEAVGEMKASCPILSKELNPAMIFNFEEYGMVRDPHYDLGHASHSHADLAKRGAHEGCGCGCGTSSPNGNSNSNSNRGPGKQLYARHEAHANDAPEMCLPGGRGGCNHEHSFATSTKAPSGLERLLGGVFPKGNPALSSLLATVYISLFPNLILFATPSAIPNRVLRVMVGFAVGGLLGDVFLHLLPHMFSGEHSHGHDHNHDHDHHTHDGPDEHVRNTVYGCAIFLGLTVFFAVDKFMRLFGSGHSHSHSHQHSHSHGHDAAGASGHGSASDSDSKHRLRKRRSAKPRRATRDANEADDEKDSHDEPPAASRQDAPRQIKLSAYLNLIADATHNFTDGLAMSASFYLSHAAGLSTFVAVFFHEIPHELGDFAILVQSGFSRTSALASQFFTALGAIAGTIAGILIEEAGKGNSLNLAGLYTPGVPVFAPSAPDQPRPLLASLLGGILGLLPPAVAGVPWSKLVIPFTAGGFIYVGTVSVLPDLLQPDDSDGDSAAPAAGAKGRAGGRLAARTKARRGVAMALTELGAMLVGLGIMAAIALGEGSDH